MQANKLFVILPDGVGIRNYLYSQVFESMRDDLTLVHDFDDRTVAYLSEELGLSNHLKLPRFSEGAAEKFLRELNCLVRLKVNAAKTQNPTLLSNWNRSHKNTKNKIFYRAVELASCFFGARSLDRLERRYQRQVRRNPFFGQITQLLQQYRPAQLFCTHQRGLVATPVFAAARDMGITTTTVIFSWDNLPKARLALRADRYLVWSEHMKSEMALFYPDIAQQQVMVTGTPQFEFYGQPKRIIAKDHFFTQFGLDPAKKIICFSGDDLRTSPDDPQYLRDIAHAVTAAGMDAHWQILLRRCPVDFSGRFDAVVADYPYLIKTADPVWHTSQLGWTHTFAKTEDVDLLVNTVFYSDLVINVGSTMAFDFSMFGKPAVFIHYDQRVKTNPEWSVQTIYRFQHFRSMPDPGAVWWLHSADSIVETIAKALSANANPAMELWKSKIIGDPFAASANIRRSLENRSVKS